MTVVILQNMPDNTLGHLAEVLEERALPYCYWNMALMPPETMRLPVDVTGLVILGGAMNVDEVDTYPYLLAGRRMIRDAMAADVPVFGICLGAQMIARTLDAPVEKNPVPEVGWTPITLTGAGREDPVLSVLAGGVSQFQWHEDTFHLPRGAVHLARSADCERQAFRFQNNVYGVQFHPEVTMETIRKWLAESSSLSPDQAEQILAESRTAFDERQRLSREMFHRFCRVTMG